MTPSYLICTMNTVGLVVVTVAVVVVQYRNEEQSYTENSTRLQRKNTERALETWCSFDGDHATEQEVQ